VDAEGLVEAVSAGVGAAVAVGATMRRYWTARERRQQAAFKLAVELIVDRKTEQILSRQVQFEQRQGRHLDRQDRAIADIRRIVETQRGHHRG
jgi:hypothetical protein